MWAHGETSSSPCKHRARRIVPSKVGRGCSVTEIGGARDYFTCGERKLAAAAKME